MEFSKCQLAPVEMLIMLNGEPKKNGHAFNPSFLYESRSVDGSAENGTSENKCNYFKLGACSGTSLVQHETMS